MLRDKKPVGKRVAIIGAGGIGFDVAEFLAHGDHWPETIDSFLNEWGVDKSYAEAGGMVEPQVKPSARDIYLMQRSGGKLGARLGKTTGWIHRSSLKHKKIKMLGNVRYQKIDDEGLHITVNDEPRLLEVDNVVICAGQVSLRDLQAPLEEAGMKVHLIGGAELAAELDAKRAIDQGSRLAAEL